MDQSQGASVQEMPIELQAFLSQSVQVVSHNGMGKVRQVDPYLVGTSRVRGHFNQSEGIGLAQGPALQVLANSITSFCSPHTALQGFPLERKRKRRLSLLQCGGRC